MKLLYIRNQLLEILSDIKKQPYSYALSLSQKKIEEAVFMMAVEVEINEAVDRVLARSVEGELQNA